MPAIYFKFTPNAETVHLLYILIVWPTMFVNMICYSYCGVTPPGRYFKTHMSGTRADMK